MGVKLPPRVKMTRGAPNTHGHFDSATFEAKISEVKGLPSGELRVVLLIPESDSKEGRTLLDAYAHALQVVVTKMSYDK